MIKALMISGRLVKDHEFIYPYYRLLEEDIHVDVCLLGGNPVNGILGTRIPPNKDQEIIEIDKCQIENYDLLIIPGGAKAMEYLRQNEKILKFIFDFNKENKTIASICHGAQLLISAKIVSGRKVSGYYSVKDDIINAGGLYIDEPSVVDKNLITTAHYKHLGPWMKKTIEIIKSKI